MRNDTEVIAEAVRIEYSENDGKLYLVFEITNPKFKDEIKKNWTKNIEYRLIDKQLVKNDD